MADPLRHRQTKGAATDMDDLRPPRHIPTLPQAAVPDKKTGRRGSASQPIPEDYGTIENADPRASFDRARSRLLSRWYRWFESISLQQRVCCEPKNTAYARLDCKRHFVRARGG